MRWLEILGRSRREGHEKVKRIVCISDTHDLYHKLDMPDGDILVHAGDITEEGRTHDIQMFAEWLDKQPYQHKIAIAGNHDYALEDSSDAREILRDVCNYLHGNEVIIGCLKFYGFPWTPRFGNLAFNVDRNSKEMLELCKSIPLDTDILISHGPPYGILDTNYYQEKMGCKQMLTRVGNLKPRAHIFGHCHASHGIEEINNTQFVNAAICISKWLPLNKPIIIDV
jgi:Icc-related predicted phosphoesterase